MQIIRTSIHLDVLQSLLGSDVWRIAALVKSRVCTLVTPALSAKESVIGSCS